jgi:hypothetical protein
LIACGVALLLGASVLCQLRINWKAYKREKREKSSVRKRETKKLTENDANHNPMHTEKEWWEEEEGEEYTVEVGASSFLGVVLSRKVQSGRKEVTSIQDGGLAAKGRKVEVGDVLLKINDIEVGELPEGGTQQLLVETRRPFTLHFTRMYRLAGSKVEFLVDGISDADGCRARDKSGADEQLGGEEPRPERYTVVLGDHSTLGIVLTRKTSGYKVVTDIQPGGLADKYGAIELGDVLEKVGNKEVKELEEIETKSLLEHELRPLTLKFRRPEEQTDGDLGELNTSLDGPPDTQASEQTLEKALEEQEQLIEAKPEVMHEREREAEKWRKRIQRVENMMDSVSGIFGGSGEAKEDNAVT